MQRQFLKMQNKTKINKLSLLLEFT